MAINYNDERFAKVEAEKQEALTENEKLYSGMVNESDKYYQAQIDAANQYAETQKKNQQEQTDFAIEKIEQQKEQAHKDYLKEQTASYVDWQKQSNQYGANAEQMATSGLKNTGYSESSEVSMFNQYQGRVSTAREGYNTAVLNYDNAMKDARLQNNSILAEIAYNTLQTTLELSLQGFQYKNNLLLEQANKKLEINNTYYARYQDVVDQINTENALLEQQRQHNASMAMRQAELDEEKRQYDLNLKEEQRQFNIQNGIGIGGMVNSAIKNLASGAKFVGKSVGNTSKKATKNNFTNSGKTVKNGTKVNTDSLYSVLNKLGMRNASASQVNALIKSGAIKETEKNGVLTYSVGNIWKNVNLLPKSVRKKLGLG